MSLRPSLVVVGGGGHGRSLIDAAESMALYDIVGIVDTDSSIAYKAYGVIGTDDDLPYLRSTGIDAAAIGVGYMGGGRSPRPQLLRDLLTCGYELPPIIDKTAAIASDAIVDKAVFIGKQAVVNAAARIGSAAIVNSGAIVEHDCMVDDLVHVSVGAKLCGGVRIGRGAFIGAGATIIQGVSVGPYAIVGAGAIVLRNVPANRTVVGVFNG